MPKGMVISVTTVSTTKVASSDFTGLVFGWAQDIWVAPVSVRAKANAAIRREMVWVMFG